MGPKLKQINHHEVASKIDFLEVGPKVKHLIDTHNAQFAINEDTGRLTLQEVNEGLSIADFSPDTHQVPLDICSSSPEFVKTIL